MERCTKPRARCSTTGTPSLWRVALVLVASSLGCGGLVGPPQPPPVTPPVNLTVAPASASVLLGEMQTFSTTVGNSSNTAVNWSVNGVPGGNATVGTISSAGVYAAPAILPAPATVSVRATSAADASVSSSSAVMINSDISIAVAPQSAPVELGASRPFVFTLNSAGNPNRGVTWTISGSACAGASCGTVDALGNYTAPQILITPPNVSLVATSVADPSKSAAANITVTSSFSLAVSGPSTITAGNTAAYAAALTPVPNSNPSPAISWSIAGMGCAAAACGTISAAGVYTAPSTPPSPASVQILATPQADPSKAASVSLLILPAVSVTISPSSATVPLGSVQALQATVTGAQDTTVTWDVNGVVGGNITMGTILNSQTSPDGTNYTAPQAMPAGGSVTVHARSNGNPGVSASALVTLIGPVSVTLTPASQTLAINHTQTFSVVVNNTSNQNVAWTVNGVPGGNSATGQICAQGSNPCQPVSISNGGSVDYVAPAGLPSPNPVTITATSQTQNEPSASSPVTILAHIVVSVLPANVIMATTGQLRFTANVTGTGDQQVVWQVTGNGCGPSGACGFVDSTGLYTAPPSPASLNLVATSLEDVTQSGTAAVQVDNGLAIFSLSPTSAYAGSAGGFTLLVTGNNFSPSDPGPGSTMLLGSGARATSCASATQCITSLSAADLAIAGNLSVQMENPDGLLSNTEIFVVLALGTGAAAIPLTPSSPNSYGNDIVVVELSTNGGSGDPANVSLNVAAIGPYSVATSSCTLGGSPVVIQRPAQGTGTADVCVFSLSALNPSFQYTITGPPTPDITVSNREPLGLGILHLTLQVSASAAPGPRTLFIQNPAGDKAAGSGAIEVQ